MKKVIDGDYFAYWFRLNQTDQYLIWIYGDPDSILLEGNSSIPVFHSEMALAQYARRLNRTIVNEEPVLHDLDAVERWLQNTDALIDCDDLLSAWNLFLDVSHALDRPFKGNRDLSRPRTTLRDSVYDKLFYGNNVCNLTPDGEYYIPVWTGREREKIAEILTDGLILFKQHIVPANPFSEPDYAR